MSPHTYSSSPSHTHNTLCELIGSDRMSKMLLVKHFGWIQNTMRNCTQHTRQISEKKKHTENGCLFTVDFSVCHATWYSFGIGCCCCCLLQRHKIVCLNIHILNNDGIHSCGTQFSGCNSASKTNSQLEECSEMRCAFEELMVNNGLD